MPKSKSRQAGSAKPEMQLSVVSFQNELRAKKKELKNQLSSRLIGLPLCPYHGFFAPSLLKDDSRRHGETYVRSEVGILRGMDVKDPNPFYSEERLPYGDRAHIGGYKNSLERVGDRYQRKGSAPEQTTPGDAMLYDQILEFKNQTCHKIVSALPKTKYIKAGHYNGYPLIMVYINRKTAGGVKGEKISDAAFAAWVNVLLSYYIGLVNYYSIRHDLGIELVRRSGFGFLSPTAAPTGESFRINVGLIPDEYVDILVKALKYLDKALEMWVESKKPIPALPEGIFYGSKEHKKYLSDSKYNAPDLNNIKELLFKKVEKSGKTTIQNIERTSYARDGISAEVVRLLGKKPSLSSSLYDSLMWAVKRMQMSGGKLRFKQGDTVSYPSCIEKKVLKSHYENKRFWEVISLIISRTEHKRSIVRRQAKRLQECCNSGNIYRIFATLECMNESLFIRSIERVNAAPVEDGYGSDSDCEDEIPLRRRSERIVGKKIIVSNGMRAIWSALSAIAREVCSYRIYFDSPYYEVALGLKLFSRLDLDSTHDITRAKSIAEAKVIIRDANACVTTEVGDAQDMKALFKGKNKILVLDSTNMTSTQGNAYIRQFAQSRSTVMFFLSSGLKNEQLGADKNAYGTVRIFTKDKGLLETYYKTIKANEPPVFSPVAHQFRRDMKQIGAVPTNAAYLKPPSP